MKYCRTCKTRAKDTDTVCTRCGAALAILGARPAGAGGNPAGEPMMLTLQGQIEALQVAQQQNVRRSRLLALLCSLVLLAILITAYIVYDRTVLAYAVLRNVTIEQDPTNDTNVKVSFEIVKPGKVAFDRRSGARHTEKMDHYSRTGPDGLQWSWDSDARSGIDFHVVYREGLFRTSETRHFNVGPARGGGSIDVVFVLDTTSSMDPYISSLKQKCVAFAEVVRKEGHDCQLGLVGFGDVNEGEPIYEFEPTGDVAAFQNAVGRVPRTGGGDIPESSLEAVQKPLRWQFRPGAAVCFVLITDADCHHPDRVPAVRGELLQRKAITYVTAPREFQNRYAPLCVNGGKFYSFEEARFEDILLNVAQAVANQIKSTSR